MKLSDLREGDVGRFPSYTGRFIVSSRTAEDRCSGSTRITFENGGVQDYLWDEKNPQVEKLGRGKLYTQIVLDP